MGRVVPNQSNHLILKEEVFLLEFFRTFTQVFSHEFTLFLSINQYSVPYAAKLNMDRILGQKQ